MSARGLEEIRERLGQDERLIWVGYPRRGLLPPLTLKQALVVTMILLVLTLITVVLIRNPQGGLIVLVIIGWYLMLTVVIGRLIDALRRQFTVYGLTDRRAIVVTGMFSRTEQSLRLGTQINFEIYEHPNLIGSIRCVGIEEGWYRKNKKGEIKPVTLFRGIVGARQIYDMLHVINRNRAMRLGLRAPSGPEDDRDVPYWIRLG